MVEHESKRDSGRNREDTEGGGVLSLRRPVILSGLLGALAAVALVGFISLGESFARPGDDNGESGGKKAKNVILLIGDGMDEQQITAARNYELGADGRFALDTLRYTGDKTTYSITPAGEPDYTPESASTATAWSTGSKTVDGRISTDRNDKDLHPTILELAKSKGLKTGNVSTAELTDATPAAQMAHVANRSCQGPQNMGACPQDRKSAGGPGSIAEQSIDNRVDVLLGGGAARYDQPITEGPDAGQTVSQDAAEDGYQVVRNEGELAAVRPGQRVLGLFNAGNQTQEWTGQPASNPPSGPQVCNEANRDQKATPEPSLSQQTQKAIDLLGAKKSSKKGFFLQVEGASIDKRAHASDPCGQIGELVAFDKAVKVALDYARKNKDTQVMVTGDHSHTPQIIEDDSNPPGFASRLTTKEGQVETISYGTGRTPSSQEHTGAQIRIAAEGPGAVNVLGLIDDTDQYGIMAGALGLNRGR